MPSTHCGRRAGSCRAGRDGPLSALGSAEDAGAPFDILQIRPRLYGDPYHVIGVRRDASEAEIKKAYFRLAREVHPDKCTTAGAEAAFKRLKRAYDILTNPRLRDAYDRWGQDGVRGQEAHRAG
eukprot:gene24770-26765_t